MSNRILLALAASVASFTGLAAVDSIERSSLFEPRVDEGSGVPYKVLKHGTGGAWNHQQLYFVQKSMTDDGRFLLVCSSDNEYKEDGGRAKMRGGWYQRVQIIDLENDSIIDFGGKVHGFCTCLDRKNDRVWQVDRDGFVYYDLKSDAPTNTVRVCPFPAELLDAEKQYGKIRVFVGHLTLSADSTGAFIDTTYEHKSVQGYMNFITGRYEKWGETDFYLFHGQTNPKNPKIALACFEDCWHAANYEVDRLSPEEKAELKEAPTKPWNKMHSIYSRPSKWAYPRLQLVEPGRRTVIVPLYCSGATHERWDEQGEGFYWCNRGVWYHDLATSDEYKVSPHGAHAFMSADRRFVVSDDVHPAPHGWYRGCRWRTYFHDREKKCGVYFNSDIPRYAPCKEKESNLHPDPHPQFVCGDRYVLWTHNQPGRMELAFAKTSDLAAACGRDPFGDLPAIAQPDRVAKLITEQLLSTRPECYIPKGYKGNGYCDKGYGNGTWVPYAVVSTWVNALACARIRGDQDAAEKLIRLYDDFLPGGSKNAICSRPYHVDDTIFGSIPLEIYLANGDKRCLAEGLRYADTQWSAPCEESIKERHAQSKEKQEKYWAEGYTPQTRLWIDDMYMINAIQTQAYRATGDRKYVDRAAKEMCLYLDKIQIKSGWEKGLFYHAPDVKYIWGRGDGWMAAGMPLVLRYLPKDSPYRAKIVAGFKTMMETLFRFQREDGMWSQLVNMPQDPRNWPEYSCTAMFTYAMIEGVKLGLLDPEIYAPAARRGWLRLCEGLDEYGNVPQVCCGTGKKNDLQYYFDRIRVHGDPHGQCAVLWCARALLEMKSETP